MGTPPPPSMPGPRGAGAWPSPTGSPPGPLPAVGGGSMGEPPAALMAWSNGSSRSKGRGPISSSMSSRVMTSRSSKSLATFSTCSFLSVKSCVVRSCAVLTILRTSASIICAVCSENGLVNDSWSWRYESGPISLDMP